MGLAFRSADLSILVVGSTYNLNTKSRDLSNLVSRVPPDKCLGVLLDEKLTFETHIEYICKKACAGKLKDKLQKIQNRAGRVITGSSYDVRSADVLNNLKWKTLETRRFHTKATLMYKILNDLSAPPTEQLLCKTQ